MSDDQFAGLLIHTVTVLRRREGPVGEQQKDPFGQPTKNEAPVHELMGRCSRASGGERNSDRSRDVIVANYKLFLDAGADLREDDVVTVTDPAGNIICEKAEVDFCTPVYDGEEEHHREAKLVTQRQAQ